MFQLPRELDIHNVDDVKLKVYDEITLNGSIDLDLQNTIYMDSSGMGFILGAIRLAKGAEFVRLHNTRPNILRTFHTLGLDRVFTIC